MVDPFEIELLLRSRELVDRPRDIALFSLLGYEGLRPGEATALLWHELIDENGRARHRVTIARTWSLGCDLRDLVEDEWLEWHVFDERKAQPPEPEKLWRAPRHKGDS